MTSTTDRWLNWLQQGRSGGDSRLASFQAAQLAGVRDRVLRSANISEGETVLDTGCGDGLIAFGALDLVGAGGRVIFTDISKAALDHCAEAAEAIGVAGRCTFMETGAERLAGIDDGSVDAVTVRSVLIYVDDRQAAFSAFHRVLRPGGRLSLFEPINSFERSGSKDMLWGIDVAPVAALADKVRAVYERIQPADSPISNFDERDLLREAQAAGFATVSLRLDARIAARLPERPAALSWEALVNAAPNPLAPSLAAAMSEALTGDERAALEAHMRAQFEAGAVTQRSASAYLQATK